MSEKLPPHNIEAEEAVIGSLLIDSDAIINVAQILRAEDFFAQQNKLIYDSCLSLYQQNESINQITVAQELSQQGKLEEIGGVAYLSQLVSTVPTSLLIESYAQIVYRLTVMRRLISASSHIAAIGYETDSDVDAAISKAEDILFKVKQQRSRGDFIPLRSVLSDYLIDIKPASHDKPIPHIPTGFAVIDDLLAGLQRSSLIVLGARTSVGKTSLALNIARNAAIDQKACVAIFSLEMAKHEIVQRLLSSEADVDSKKVRHGNYNEGEERRIMDASGVLSEAPIYIDDSVQLKVIEMRSKARRLDFEHKIDLIIVDYIQLIKGEGRSENRVQELSEITRSLEALARDLEVPVLALSQLRRLEHYASATRKPQLSDLRESGSIEQDADVVIFIHREEKDQTATGWAGKDEDEFKGKDTTDIIIAKNRNGPIGEVQLRFIPDRTKFDNLLVPELSPTPQQKFME